MKHKRIMAPSYGSPEVLEFVTADLPEPGEGEVSVKVLAAGIALADIMWLSGKVPGGPKPPYTPGYDLVGVVDQVGKGVTSVASGQIVAAIQSHGSYSEYANLPADKLVPVSGELDPAEVVCLTLNYIAAYQILTRVAKISRGARILVHGAAGGVGTACLQLGALLGMKVFGTASLPKHELVTHLRGIPIDYRNEDFVERIHDLTDGGVDLVIDHIGGKHFSRSVKALRAGGRLVATSSLSALKGKGTLEIIGGFAKLPLWNFLPNNKHASFYDVHALNSKNPEWYAEDLELLMSHLSDGRIKPVIAKQMPLDKASKAMQLLWEGKVRGKIVLTSEA